MAVILSKNQLRSIERRRQLNKDRLWKNGHMTLTAVKQRDGLIKDAEGTVNLNKYMRQGMSVSAMSLKLHKEKKSDEE